MSEPSILNVDDYEPGRYARSKVLRHVGFAVIEASTGEEALRKVVQYKSPLVLLDVNLPDISGFEVCRRIRSNPEIAATTIVHISSSNVQARHQVHGLDSGADGYLIEPIDPELLVATVNAFLRARRAEDALRKSSEELRWFSYRVAHDLSEPLRTISVYAQMLRKLEAVNASAETASYLDFMVDATVRMRSFMDGLLDYSQAAGGRSEPVEIDCKLLLERVTADLGAAMAESGAQVVQEGLPVVRCDKRLEYVFQNLVSNAIKYRRSGVTPLIRVSARRQGDLWVFSVEDNGIGIEAEFADRIFEVFERLHGREIPGNGIGLALCRKIIQAHGGTIWVESQPGVGAKFFFTLPFYGGAR